MARQMRLDITGVHSKEIVYGLLGGQYFMETEKAFEIWQDDPLPRRVHRLPKSRIVSVRIKTEDKD